MSVANAQIEKNQFVDAKKTIDLVLRKSSLRGQGIDQEIFQITYFPLAHAGYCDEALRIGSELGVSNQ